MDSPAGGAAARGGGGPTPPASPLDAAANALTALWQSDINFMDQRGRTDTRVAFERISLGHELLVAAFGRGERPQLQLELEQLRQELDAAQKQVQLSELRVAHTAARVAELERAAQRARGGDGAGPPPAAALSTDSSAPSSSMMSSALDWWYPIATSPSAGPGAPVALWFHGRPWALFRGPGGAPAGVLDECAHRACPLSLGTVTPGGTLACPYHGWEYTPGGECIRMPSCTFLPGVGVDALTLVEADSLLWAWPGVSTPAAVLPRLACPPGFTLMAAVTTDVDRPPHDVIMALLTSAQAPSGAAPAVLGAAWDAAACVSSAFEPPCMVLSVLRLSSPATSADDNDAAATAATAAAAATAVQPPPRDTGDATSSRLVHQVHMVIPTQQGRCRVLYRLAINWAGGTLLTLGPAAPALWRSVAEDMLREQLATVVSHGVTPPGDSAAHRTYAQWRASVADAA